MKRATEQEHRIADLEHRIARALEALRGGGPSLVIEVAIGWLANEIPWPASPDALTEAQLEERQRELAALHRELR